MHCGDHAISICIGKYSTITQFELAWIRVLKIRPDRLVRPSIPGTRLQFGPIQL